MKTMKMLLAGVALAGVTAVNAYAGVITVPATGLSTQFNWNAGIGPALDSFSLTVAGPSKVSVTLTDMFIAGDEFALSLDGNAITWNTSGYVGNYFQGVASNVLLSAGTHSFGITLTKTAPGYTAGTALATFGAVTAVPEPATYGMLIAGLGMLAYAARRKKA